MAELLEGRMVLSGAPIDGTDVGQTLAEYLTIEQEMGPIPPAEIAAPSSEVFTVDELNELLGHELPEGESCEELPEGCGEGGGEGSGSGGEEGGETATVTGTIGLEGLEGELSCSLDGVSGSLTVDGDGNFVLLMENPEIGAVITITVTDSEGNVTSHTFTYDG